MEAWTVEIREAFGGYVEALTEVIGHADRAEPLKDCRLGLLTPVKLGGVEHHAIAPLALGAIEGDIGALENHLRRIVLTLVERYAD